MLDQLRQQIQTRLDELLGEADKLRHALAALGSRDRAATPSASAARLRPLSLRGVDPARPRPLAQRPASPARSRATAAATISSPEPAESPASTPTARRARGAARTTRARQGPPSLRRLRAATR